MNFDNDSDHFDQHFLIDQEIISKLINESNLNKEDIIVEIGPGNGVLTKLIAPKVNKVFCIELDERLRSLLLDIKKEYENIELIFGSALDVYIPDCTKIITALPYSIIEPLIDKLLKCKFNEIIMITGNKFATNIEQITLNRLSLLTNCFFKIQKIMEIIPDAFSPKPRVMSAMIRLTPIKEKDLTKIELLVLRFMFYYRDKKVKNALLTALIRTYKANDKLLTQNSGREIINLLAIPKDILEKNFENCSNEELIIIYNKIITIEYNF